MSLPRANPAEIATSLKEAFVDSLLNLTFAQISGAGDAGRVLFGARPRVLLNSGFLLPQKEPEGDDEVTSPIWVSAHGLQMQVSASHSGPVTIQPRCSVYVRVFPSEEDLKRPDCRLGLALRPEVDRQVQADRRRRLADEWAKVKGTYTSRAKHPDWAAIDSRITAEVHAAYGITAMPTAPVTGSDDGALEEPNDAVEVTSAAAAPSTATSRLRDDIYDAAPVPHKWLRLEIDIPPLVLNLGLPEGERAGVIERHAAEMNSRITTVLDDWAKNPDPNFGGELWGYRRVRVPPSLRNPWQAFLDHARKSPAPIALPAIALGWNIDLSRDWLDDSRRNLFVSLENRSTAPQQHVDETDEAIFLTTLHLSMPRATHRPLRLERVEPSYRYNAYLTYPAIGSNGGVIDRGRTDNSISLATTWKPRYVQPRIIPTETAGVRRQMRLLAQPDGLDQVVPIEQAFEDWLRRVVDEVDPTDGLDSGDTTGRARETQAFESDVRSWRAELGAIRAGFAVLRESRIAWSKRGPQTDPRAAVYEAWLAMNEAMANFMQKRFGSDDSEWRLFQLAFIVANIPTFASRISGFEHHFDEHRDDAVTLLYFATGGGKSEAFFGLLIFSVLLDRLRGKGKGITAFLRYPLRLLTIQQAQRCAKVLAQAELIRRRWQYDGDPIAIGFWVGSGGSPNNHRAPGVDLIPVLSKALPEPAAEAKLVEENAEYAALLHSWRKLPTCPFCGNNTALRRVVKHERQTLAHVCTNRACESNAGEYQPLPFYIVDEDIYDLAPSVLLGTVDKLALIGHSPATIRRIFGMLGAAPWRHAASGRLHIPTPSELKSSAASRGMEELYPAYPAGRKHFNDPFPSLIIQDEAHLLDESLGTFAGLFESALDAVFNELGASLDPIVAKDPSGKLRRPKVIAASATVAEPQRQLEHLYQRAIPATQFPYPGPSLYESFYSTPQLADAKEVDRRAMADVEVSSRQARVYTAFMTNGRPHTATSVAVLSSFHFVATRLFDQLCSARTEDLTGARELLSAHVSEGPLQRLHRDRLAAATASELATLVDLHRIALTYVTNKKGGDQIMAAEAEETRKRHLNAGIMLEGIETRLITGSVEQGAIQAVVDTAQRRVRPGELLPPIREQLRSVIATSAVSHGVDVDEFNSMFFAGMPSDIAEYIQASSRIGRAHVGFAVLVPTPQRRRDRHIVHTFDSFHRFLERMVQPAAIDHWAERAIERAYPSFLQAYLLGVVPTRELLDLPTDDKEKAKDLTYIPIVRSEHDKRGAAFVDEVNGFLERAIGLKPEFSPPDPNHYRRMLAAKTHVLLNDVWRSQLYGGGTVNIYFKNHRYAQMRPMTSLRDVDEAGRIVMSSRDTHNRKQDARDVTKLMSVVRHGVSPDDAGEEEE